MGKGTKHRGEISERRDPLTNVVVKKMTADRGNTIHPYFTQPLLSADGRQLLTASDRTGAWQLYLMDLGDGSLIQLTDDGEIGFQSAQLDGAGMIAWYWSGDRLKSVDCSSLRTEEHYRVPRGFQPGSLSLAGDGAAVDFCYTEKLELSTYTGKLYSDMRETFYRRPRSVLMRLCPADNGVTALWGECDWISHVVTSPVDSNMVVFNHEGPWHLVQRTWVVDCATSECRPLLRTEPYVERAGHEFFTAKGRLVTQFGRRESPRDANWKCSDVFIFPDGTGYEKFDYKPGPKPMHVQVNYEETLGIADGYFAEGGPEDGNNYMSLIRYEEGEARQKMLCVHGTSWKTQHSHPHPLFARDGRSVIFGSDAGGHSNVYMAPADLW